MGTAVWITLILCFTVTEASRHNAKFDQAFSQFLEEHSYRGGAVAAMSDGRLVIARGYGMDRQGQEVTAESKFHVSSVAKSLTAVAVLQLVQEGRIQLQNTVFGSYGLLPAMQPWQAETVDNRLYDISLEQLLHHSGGWDSSMGPLYDPLLNTVYLDRGHKVPDIAKEMGVKRSMGPNSLISYMMSQPLDFTPGTQTVYSNFGYLILGRVIEEVSGMAYRDYVKKYILEPCGMWHTRLKGRPQHLFDNLPRARTPPTEVDPDPSIYDHLDMDTVDSALGWYSNVYDLMRFTRCAFDRQTLIDDTHLGILMSRLTTTADQRMDTWFTAGFRTNGNGSIWQVADLHADDLILYHNSQPKLTEDEGIERPMADSWVILLYGKSINNMMHNSRTLMRNLDLTPEQNYFLHDLSDLYKHTLWDNTLAKNTPEYTVRYQIDEHHISSYVNALRDEGFNVQWVTSYPIHRHTRFTLIGQRITQPIRSMYDYIFEHGFDHRTLLKRKLFLESAGYNMTYLHSYKSQSHSDPFAYMGIFRRDAYGADTIMKYGTDHLPEPYEKLAEMYRENSFYPIAQSVLFHSKDERISFIYLKKQNYQVEFRHFYDLSDKQISKHSMDSARAGLQMTYLSSYSMDGKARFSAIYSNETKSTGLLEIQQPQDRATEIILSNLKDGVVPKFIVGYQDEQKKLKFAMYFQRVH